MPRPPSPQWEKLPPLFTGGELRRLRIEPWQMQRWRQASMVTELLPSIFLRGAGPPSWKEVATAALAWGGKGSALCLSSALVMHGVGAPQRAPLQLGVVGTPKPPPAPAFDLEIFTRRRYGEWDVQVVDGLAVTRIERTLIDLAGVTDDRLHERLVDEALRTKKTTPRRLRAAFHRLEESGVRGIGRMRELFARRGWTLQRLESPLEDQFAVLLASSGLPPPASGYDWPEKGLASYRVDFAYPAFRLGIECDSYEWHAGRTEWTNDQRRNNSMVADGWAFLHFVMEDLDDPEEVARLIFNSLSARGWEPGMNTDRAPARREVRRWRTPPP